jgi:hypothetical protein
MHHVAIMNKSWELIPKILSGEKTIESRWYMSRRAPWGTINSGDTVFFKNSGEDIIARAQAVEVLQFTFLNISEINHVIRKYGKQICLVNSDPVTWDRLPKYAILIRLQNPQKVSIPFAINKSGFGAPAAWITIPNIKSIKI